MTVATRLHDAKRLTWLIGYELELATYLIAAVLLAHTEGLAIRGAVRDLYSRRPRVRFTCYVAWWLFLLMSVVHCYVFAAYNMLLLVSTLHGSSHVTFTPVDLLSLISHLLLRVQLGKAFFRKYLDWPLAHGFREEMRVHAYTRA